MGGTAMAIVVVMVPLSSAWIQPVTSLSGQLSLHAVQPSSLRQARVCTGSGGQLANEHLPISPLWFQRPWRRQGYAEFGCNGKVALAAKKKKKKNGNTKKKKKKKKKK